MEVVASLSQGRTADARCVLFTHKSVPVIFEPPCIIIQHDSKDGLNFFRLYFLNYTWHVNYLHNI